jgi:hypothetical protein
MHNKLLWLGLAVGAVLVLALVQLTYATLWQPPSGSAKAGSSGGLLSRALAINGQQRYQQLGASDDQELAEFSEGALKPHGARDSSSSQQV